MKNLMENWRKHLAERGNPNEQQFQDAVIDFVVGQMQTMGMNAGEAADRARIQKEVHGIVDLAMQQLGLGGEPEPVNEAITLDIEVGDILLGGKYKNKRIEVKEIGEDELGQPTVNGKPILKVRIEKHLPDDKKSKKTLDAEKDK
tara:strand:+ start:1799 stop:2233 length:435 start_codon:yes stop_codon:yes gene_type:complete